MTNAPEPIFRISTIHYPAGEYRHQPRQTLQLRLIRRGSSYADVDLGTGERRIFTRPGDLLLSLPEHAVVFRIDDARDLTLLEVEGGRASRILAKVGGSLEDLHTLLAKPFRDGLVAEICRRLQELDDASSPVAQWSVSLLLASLLRTAKSISARKGQPVLSYRRLQLVLDKIKANLDRPMPVSVLADTAGLPTRVFATAFKEATGLPVHQYVLRSRADRAAALLTSTDLPLSEIAQRAGFSHQAHMHRVVSRLKGKTPGQIRTSRRTNAEN